MSAIWQTILAWAMSLITFGGLTVMDAPKAPQAPVIPADALTQELTIMSFNVYYQDAEERLDAVKETILKELPDSLGLQEATGKWKSILSKALQDKYAMVCKKGRMFGLDESTPILYLKDKYTLVKQGVFWLSPKPKRTSIGWDAALPRVAGYAVLKDKTTGFTYLHVNAHFDHMGPIARANSARMIADFINEMNLPTVFTADVNASPGTPPVQYLQAGGLTDMRDAAPNADLGGTFHGFNGLNGNTSVIDFVMANQYLKEAAEFKVIRDEYDWKYPSDHFAVAATLTLNSAGEYEVLAK